jgi:hypothetical protein
MPAASGDEKMAGETPPIFFATDAIVRDGTPGKLFSVRTTTGIGDNLILKPTSYKN